MARGNEEEKRERGEQELVSAGGAQNRGRRWRGGGRGEREGNAESVRANANLSFSPADDRMGWVDRLRARSFPAQARRRARHSRQSGHSSTSERRVWWWPQSHPLSAMMKVRCGSP